MTRRLVEARIEVMGFDMDQNAAAAGARPPSRPSRRSCCSGRRLMSLPDSKVVERVVLGDGGVLASCRAGQIVVDLSTAAARVRPAASRGLSLSGGVSYVDAGISGGAVAAEKGTLTLMVGRRRGCDRSARLGVFAPIARKVVTMGSSGAGHTTKLLNNFLNAVSLAATAEVMVAGRKAGLDLHRLLEVLNASSGVNFATLNRFPKIVDGGDYLEGGLTGKLMTKDVVLYTDLLHELGVAS